MKYFFDTEFIEGFNKPLFGKRRHFIDLISIGIIAEDGREFYAISNEFNPKDADEWVKENVISKLPLKRWGQHDSPRQMAESLLWKNMAMIENDIQGFIAEGGVSSPNEFYAYYADYDWVLFCSIFGRMINLPKGYPMYCHDLKQMLDEKAELMDSADMVMKMYEQGKLHDVVMQSTSTLSISGWALSQKIELLKSQFGYPKQENEHSAIDDARWNKKLYEFLKKL